MSNQIPICRSFRDPDLPRPVRAHAPPPAAHHRRGARAGLYRARRPHRDPRWSRRRTFLVPARQRACCDPGRGGRDAKFHHRESPLLVSMIVVKR